MGGKVSLPLTIEIAFSAGALDTGTLTWTDVSSYVRKGSISFNRGWDTESQEPIAGRAALSFNNESGNFTPGKTGAFGLIRNRLPIRIKQGSTVLWTGLVESWRIGWTNGMRSKVDVTCVDRWAALRRVKLDGRFIERTVAAQSPAYFWPCTDVAGASRLAASAGGVDFVPSGPYEVVLCAKTANPQRWMTSTPVAVSQRSLVSAVPGALMVAPGSGSWAPSGATSVAFTVAAWMMPSVDVDHCIVVGDNLLNFVKLARTNKFGTSIYVSSRGGYLVGYNDATIPSGWAHLAVTVAVNGSGALTMNGYVNGVLVWTDSTTWTSGGWTSPLPQLWLGGEAGFSYVCIWNRALSGAEILAQYQAGTMSGWAGETAPVRAARLQAVAPTPVTLSTTGTFTIPMSKQDLADKPLADALLECAQAEDGALHIGTDGWPKLTSRDWRTQATVAFTIPAKALASDIGWTLDDQQLTNSSAVDRMVGDATAGTATGRNDASVTLYGEQKVSRQLWLYNTADAVERANAEANMWANPLPRSSELTVDLMTKGATISAATLLAADIGQRIAISGMPAEAPTQTNFYIEAISDAVTETQWLRTFTVSPRLDFLTLDDASSGAIDSTFVLAP